MNLFITETNNEIQRFIESMKNDLITLNMILKELQIIKKTKDEQYKANKSNMYNTIRNLQTYDAQYSIYFVKSNLEQQQLLAYLEEINRLIELYENKISLQEIYINNEERKLKRKNETSN